MKAEELMLWDWVKVYDDDSHETSRPRKVIGVNYYDLEVYYDDPDSSFIDVRCDDSDCDPIPLTPEILEKNGFVADGLRAYVKGDVTVYPATNKDHFTDIDHPILSVWKAGHVRELNIRCDYVHTLQHALRLCGLTELADNIKIE